ncbi:MAG: hypothetical protein HC872_03870 [Gammaproteobacteria bacterium]|nr:hypothetical protein [Gammaproteobacteria bacterium]
MTASKILAVKRARLVEAFIDAEVRQRWLLRAPLQARASRGKRTLRFDWGDGKSRVNVTIASASDNSQVAVEHQRLPDARTADQTKAFWRERLTALKTMLER